MDCFVVLLLAMTKKNNCHCESCLQLVAISFILGLSLREFVELVAILLWDTAVLNQSPSLRGLEKPVAISTWNIISFTKFSYFVYLQIIISFYFLFFYLLLVVYGLLRFARNDSTPTLSLQDFAEGVAISFILDLSLRELLATRGNP